MSFIAVATVLNMMELCVKHDATASALTTEHFNKNLLPDGWEVEGVGHAPGFVIITISSEEPFNQADIDRVVTAARQLDAAVDVMVAP